METFKNYIVSVIRTAVPILVGSLTGWLATKNINLDSDTVRIVTLGLEGLAGILYYLVVRALEHINYRFGWLLGYAKMPQYTVVGNKLPGSDQLAKVAEAERLHDAAVDSNQ